MIKFIGKFFIFFIFAVVLGFTSCSYVSNPGYGYLKISLNSLNNVQHKEKASALRTILPDDANADYFYFKFVGYTDGTSGKLNGKTDEIASQKITIDNNSVTLSGPKALETGWWKVQVTRYKTSLSNPVQYGESAYFEITADITISRTVNMTEYLPGNGIFSYSLTYPGTGTNKTASMQIVPVSGGELYGFLSKTITGSSSAGTLNLPAGTYDVTAVIAIDGKEARLYDTLVIYSGLTSTGSFNFTSVKFYNTIYIGGTFKINSFPPGLYDSINGNDVTITAYKTGTGSLLGSWPLLWENATLPWVLGIPENNSSVELTVQVKGSDNNHYVNNKLITVYDIPVNGKFDIDLNFEIYSINNNYDGTDPLSKKLTVTSNSETRLYACPGESIKVTASGMYGHKNGSLVVIKYISDIVTVSGTGPNYSFTMPNGPNGYVTLTADFFNPMLDQPGFSIIEMPYGDTNPLNVTIDEGASTIHYEVINPLSTGIIISATSVDSTITAGTGYHDIDYLSLPEYINIKLDPPSAYGGSGSRTYILEIDDN
ncbi:MAG: hypothetical protein FWH35_09140 [Treponema sp.]|nr:hypothetical protein [Treponema sp.]